MDWVINILDQSESIWLTFFVKYQPRRLMTGRPFELHIVRQILLSISPEVELYRSTSFERSIGDTMYLRSSSFINIELADILLGHIEQLFDT